MQEHKSALRPKEVTHQGKTIFKIKQEIKPTSWHCCITAWNSWVYIPAGLFLCRVCIPKSLLLWWKQLVWFLRTWLWLVTSEEANAGRHWAGMQPIRMTARPCSHINKTASEWAALENGHRWMTANLLDGDKFTYLSFSKFDNYRTHILLTS